MVKPYSCNSGHAINVSVNFKERFIEIANTYPERRLIQVYQNYHFWWLSIKSTNWS